MDLHTLSIEELQALKAKLDGLTDTSGRSPFRSRQLHDLRLPPTKDDPRPTFFWSADPPRHAADLSKTSPYPRLMWDGTSGDEITVDSAAAERTATARGFVLVRPATAADPDPRDLLRDQLAQLSPEDRKAIAQAAQQTRISKIQAAMSDLSEAEMQELMASVEPARRGPGRPRKEDVA